MAPITGAAGGALVGGAAHSAPEEDTFGAMTDTAYNTGVGLGKIGAGIGAIAGLGYMSDARLNPRNRAVR